MTGHFAPFAFDFLLASATASDFLLASATASDLLLASATASATASAPVESADPGETLAAFLAGASVASLLLAVAVLVAYLAKVWNDLPLDSHAALFRDLCAAHRLEPEDRETLLDAAAAAQIRGVEVFVRPEALSDLADRLEDPEAKSRCWRLRRRLFGDLKLDPQDEFVA